VRYNLLLYDCCEAGAGGTLMLAIAGSLVDWLMQVQSWFRHSDWQFSISRGAVQERSNFKLSKGREEQKKRWIGSFFKEVKFGNCKL
jgi:hypothetical protein